MDRRESIGVCRYSFGFKFPEIRLKVNNDISIHRATIDRI